MSYQTIRLEINKRDARLTLNRPEKLNAFNVAMHGEVRDALERVRAEKSVRVLVLTGAGRGFCAGQDLADRAVAPGAAPVDLGQSIEKYYGPLVLALRALPIPVICAVNGVAAGAGANIALACDIVIAASSAAFIEPFCRLGLVPDTGGTYFLPRLVGTARAMGIALLGDRIPAQQAADWGLIWKCVDDAKFAEEIDPHAASRASSRRSMRAHPTRCRRNSTSSATSCASWETRAITGKPSALSLRSASRSSPRSKTFPLAR